MHLVISNEFVCSCKGENLCYATCDTVVSTFDMAVGMIFLVTWYLLKMLVVWNVKIQFVYYVFSGI